VLGTISGFDKAMTVAKLLGAPEPNRREVGNCEGVRVQAEQNERGQPFLRDVHQLDAQQMKDPPRLENLSGSRVFYVRGPYLAAFVASSCKVTAMA
jgi:hypothetical protein